MADDVDNSPVVDVNEMVLNRIKENNCTSKDSELYCLYCGNDIPEIRRKHGNIIYCVDCQTLNEKGKLN